MTLNQVMKELEAKSNPGIKRIYLNHGAKEPFFGIKISDLKVIQKKIAGDQNLALELFKTGNSDAQYLAGMVAKGKDMTVAQLEEWVKKASWHMISEYTLAWVTSEHPEGFALARKWIDAKEEETAMAGWASLSALAVTVPDEKLPMKEYSALLDRVAKTLQKSTDNIKLAMNNFVICCGTYLAPLADKAMETARKVGKVEADRGNTSCKTPDAESYIIKCRKGAPVAKKRKTVRC